MNLKPCTAYDPAPHCFCSGVKSEKCCGCGKYMSELLILPQFETQDDGSLENLNLDVETILCRTETTKRESDLSETPSENMSSWDSSLNGLQGPIPW